MMTIDKETQIIRSFISEYNYSATAFAKKADVNVHSVLRIISDDNYNPRRRTFKKMQEVIPKSYYMHIIE